MLQQHNSSARYYNFLLRKGYQDEILLEQLSATAKNRLLGVRLKGSPLFEAVLGLVRPFACQSA